MRKWVVALIATATLFVGMGVGIAAAGVPQPPVTHTKTITKTVKVPGPTRTVTPAPIVKTKTVTKLATPQACFTALDNAKRFALDAAEFSHWSSKYLPLITKAYQAGAEDGFMAGAVGTEPDGSSLVPIKMKMAVNKQHIERINQNVGEHIRKFKAAEQQCRSH